MELKMEVYSPTLELLGILEIQKSVIWEEKAFTAGSFSVESLITDETLKLLQPENIMWIAGEDAGIIECIQEEAREDGPYITVKGQTLAGILDRRILWGLYTLKGTPPEIMHFLVDDCAIHPTRSNVKARKIPCLVSLDAPAGGESIQIQRTGGTLLEALEQLGETYGVAFGVRFNPAVPQMEFWTRWGQDRSIHQTTNDPVFYSTELDDVLTSEYSYNSREYRNVSLVAGEGEGKNRVYVTVYGNSEDMPTPPTPITKYMVSLLVDPECGGTVSGGNIVESGASITITARPSDGYTFMGWRENGKIVSTSASYTFNVNADKTFTAVFAAVTIYYTATINVSDIALASLMGVGSLTVAGQKVTGNTVITTELNIIDVSFVLTRSINTPRLLTVNRKEIGHVKEGGDLLSTTLPASDGLVIDIVFTRYTEPAYTVTVSTDPSGSGTVTGAGQYQEGEQVTVSATAADGYKFSQWTENGQTVSENESYTFTSSEDRELVAVFAEKSRLPEGYTELEYIQLGAACGIDTLFKPNASTTRFVMDFEIAGTLSADMLLLGQYGTNVSGIGNRWFNLFAVNASTLGYRDNSNSYGTLNPDLSKRMIFDYNCPGGTISAGEVTKTLNKGNYTLSYDVFFGSPASADKIAPYKLYSAQIYTNDTLQRDFVPCKNPSGVVGLYDLVDKKFYKNTLSGKLTAGPAV